MPAWSRILRVLFVIYVAVTAVHIGWILAHEPFAFDAWNMAKDTHARPFTAARFFDYWGYEYTHSNPRIGQPLTYLAYKLEYFAVIVTPLAYVALAGAATILGTGRRPSWRRGRDLALFAIALGFMWFALPQLGKTMFCRAYGANYLYGAAIQLWFLVPLRLSPTARASRGACAAYVLAGVIAGACNEHTGPTLCVALLGYAWWKHRRARQVPNLAWAGALGCLAGFCAIFFAPGQGQRYDGLAQKVTLTGRLLARGITGNLDIFRDLVLAAAPLLGLMVIVAAVGLVRDADAAQRQARRRALYTIVVAIIAGSAITATIFVSPKLGPRFYLFSMMLLLAGFIAIADAVLESPRGFAPFVALAAAASIYAAAHTVPLYGRLARQSDARLAQLEASARGSVVTLDAFEQIDDNWWFLGDDVRAPNKREMLADYFDLGGVVLRGYDPTAPLGVSDVRLVPRARLSPAGCLDEHGGLELGAYRGLDLASIHAAIRAAVGPLEARLGATRVDRIDVAVEFVGARPALPRPDLLVGRWFPDRFEGWTARITRKSRATTREVVLGHDVPHDLEVFVYLVGGEARRLGTSAGEPLQYSPWRTGTYWVLACRPDECFVLAAARQGG